jgi:hypothetical protein
MVPRFNARSLEKKDESLPQLASQISASLLLVDHLVINKPDVKVVLPDFSHGNLEVALWVTSIIVSRVLQLLLRLRLMIKHVVNRAELLERIVAHATTFLRLSKTFVLRAIKATISQIQLISV